jgi:hypothetical protein
VIGVWRWRRSHGSWIISGCCGDGFGLGVDDDIFQEILFVKEGTHSVSKMEDKLGNVRRKASARSSSLYLGS